MIKYEVGTYLPRFGRPIFVTVAEVNEEAREIVEEHYVFLLEQRKCVGKRFHTDFRAIGEKEFFKLAEVMEEALARTQYILEDFVYTQDRKAHREFFVDEPGFARYETKAPFARFKIHGEFLPEMRTIVAGSRSTDLRGAIKEALKLPTVRRKAEGLG